MNYLIFTIACFSTFALLHFLIIPRVEKGFTQKVNSYKILTISFLSILKATALFLGIGGIILAMLLLSLNINGGTTLEEVSYSIQKIEGWRAFFSSFSVKWAAVILLLTLIGLVLHGMRKAKVKISKIKGKLIQEEFEVLRAASSVDNFEAKKKSSEIQAIKEHIEKWEYLKQNPQIIELPPEKSLENLIQEINEQLIYLENLIVDIKRAELDEELMKAAKRKVDKISVRLPDPRTTLEKVQVFFFSRGLLTTAKRGSLILYLLLLTLTVPTLIVTQANNLKGEASNSLDALYTLKIGFQHDNSLASLEQTLDGSLEEISDDDLSEEDSQIIEETAELYENTIADYFLDGSGIETAFKKVVRGTAVRNHIIDQFKARAPQGVKVTTNPGGSRVDNLTKAQKEVVKSTEVELDKKARTKYKDQDIRTKLRKAAKKDPNLTKRLKAELKSFQTPARRADITRGIVKDVYADVRNSNFESRGRASSDWVSRDRWKYDGPTNQKILQTQSSDFVSNLARGEKLSNSIDGIATSPEFVEMRTSMHSTISRTHHVDIPEQLRNYPPTANSPPESRVKKTVSSRIERFSTRTSQSSMASINNADAIADFGDFFAAQEGSNTNSNRSRLIQKIDQKVSTNAARSSVGMSKAARSKIASGSSFRRGRSFSRLRGFSKIGGVLIGRDETKDASKATSYNDIEWELKDGKLFIALEDSNGEVYQSVGYNSAIAYHALNYAADGRPIAVTMINAPPMFELKILTHPTLVDNAMGVRMIELDRFVDQFTGDYYKRIEANEFLYDVSALYKLTWAIRLKNIIDANMSQLSGEDRSFVYQYKQATEEILNSSELLESAARALRSGSRVVDPDHSPLKVKEEFYDQKLVVTISNLVSRSNNISEYVREAHLKYRETNNSYSSYSNRLSMDALSNALIPPPTFEVWSGVRENEFTLSGEDLLMSSNDAPLPTRFMLQMAFTSIPEYGQTIDSDEDYDDSDPWEFPSIAGSIQQKTIQGAKANNRSRIILEDVKEFVYLQRLFRMALGGNLGEAFPVEALAELHDDLVPFAPKEKVRTLRWNARSKDYIEHLANIQGYDKEEIVEILAIREELGIENDFEQSQVEQKNGLPKL